jgi:hypothetical protein
VGGADAVVIGTVQAYDYDRVAAVDIDNFRNYTLYPYRGLPTYSGYTYYYPGIISYSCETVRLVVTSSIVSVPDGSVLASTEAKVGHERVCPPDRPEVERRRLEESSAAAAKELAKAYVTVPVKVNAANCTVRTARLETDGHLKYTKDFSNQEKEIVVVVVLPPEAAKNDFCLMITPRGSDTVLVRQDFIWGPTDFEQRLVFPAAPLKEKTSETHFYVSLYSGNRLVMTKEFELER